MMDDFQYFKETEVFRLEAESRVESAQAKYDATETLYEIEKAAKEKRDFDEGVKQATAEFHAREAATQEKLDEFEEPYTLAQ